MKLVAQEAKPASQQAPYVIPEGATLEQIRAEMLHLMAGENVNQYRMGQLYGYVVDNELAQKAGYKDAPTYFRQHLADVSTASLTTYRAVVKTFSEQVAVRFGVTCLYLLTIYKEAANLKVNPEEPGPTLIEVPGENGEVTKKPFSACSVDEMRQALRLKRKPASSKPVPAEDVAQAEKYRTALKGQFPQGSNVQVQVRNEKGNSVLDFKSIPVAQVGTLILALMDHVPPGSELRRTE
ncbi:MAG TPA: hypothetical protein VK539_22185 [Myxococcaceae bacterium]|nr:hypothetical protein [Myxococcaceae bacterium]